MTDNREWVLVPRELLEEARNIAMEWTLKGRVPECGKFGQIAQDLDAMLAAAPQPPAEAQARPEKPAECADGCPPQQVCDHCQWPPGPDAEAQAQGGGEVSRFMPSDANRHRCYNCGLRIADHVPDEDGARCKREAVRHLREITAPPSAPVGVEGLIEDWESDLAEDKRDGVPEVAIRVQEIRLDQLRALAQQPAAVTQPGAGEVSNGSGQPAAVDGVADFEIHAGGEYFASVGGPRERAWKEAMHYVSTLHPDDGEPEVFEVTRRKVALAAQQGGVK